MRAPLRSPAEKLAHSLGCFPAVFWRQNRRAWYRNYVVTVINQVFCDFGSLAGALKTTCAEPGVIFVFAQPESLLRERRSLSPKCLSSNFRANGNGRYRERVVNSLKGTNKDGNVFPAAGFEPPLNYAGQISHDLIEVAMRNVDPGERLAGGGIKPGRALANQNGNDVRIFGHGCHFIVAAVRVPTAG
jgi:hypothetical protein